MNYTFDGNPEAESVITHHQQIIIEQVLNYIPQIKLAAIIMIGGYGRAEGAYIETESGCQPYNDYDYFLVFRNTSQRQATIMTRDIPCLEHLVGIEVDFFPLMESMLGKMEFSLMNAEMHIGHRVIWGDQGILDSMPEMNLDDVPASEFVRLLTNRGCLLLMNILGKDEGQYSKFINKAWLAVGDTILSRAGCYRLSYIEKRLLIEQVCHDKVICIRYLRAIDIRLRPDLYDEWLPSDMEEISHYWMQQLETLSADKSQTQWRQIPKNILRNLRDSRVRHLDRLLIEHPRLRVTMLLKDAIRKQRRGETTEDQLFDLWASYS